MKKTVFCLVFAALAASWAFAQEEAYEPVVETAEVAEADEAAAPVAAVANGGTVHWISGELSILGVGARYEFMISENLSIGANIYWSSLFFFWNELGIHASARFYPWAGIFFVGASLGFHIHTSLQPGDNYVGDVAITGVAISPEVGWRITVGERGFFIQPGAKLPITFGARERTHWIDGRQTSFGVGVGFIPYFGMGFTF